MNGCGILTMGKSVKISASARRLGLQLRQGRKWKPGWERTLFVSGEYQVPWDLLPAGFHFLKRWDAAAPLWRYGVLAADVGTKGERQRTAKLTLDLRIPLYEPGLLFIRSTEAGLALLETWRAECRRGDDVRLAFLRALHIVKPRFCALPRSWLAEEAQRAQQDARTDKNMRGTVRRLVRVEIAPGRFVKCHAGDEEKVKERFTRLQRGRNQQEPAKGKQRKPAKDKMRQPAEDKAKEKEEEKAGG